MPVDFQCVAGGRDVLSVCWQQSPFPLQEDLSISIWFGSTVWEIRSSQGEFNAFFPSKAWGCILGSGCQWQGWHQILKPSRQSGLGRGCALSAAQTRSLSLEGCPCARSCEFGVFQVAVFSLHQMNPSAEKHVSLLSFAKRCICWCQLPGKTHRNLLSLSICGLWPLLVVRHPKETRSDLRLFFC